MISPVFLELPEDWEQLFPRKSLQRAAEYLRDGRVADLRVSGEEGMITALVQGSRRRPYDVAVFVDPSDWEVPLYGDCTCLAGIGCKHVAAVLYAVQAEREGSPGGTRGGARVSWWLRQLDEAIDLGSSGSRRDPDALPQRLAYVLKCSARTMSVSTPLRVEVMMVARGRDGLYGNPTPFRLAPRKLSLEESPCLVEADLPILRALLYGLELGGASGAELLSRIIGTGRSHWMGAGKTRPPFGLGLPRPGVARWKTEPSGRQVPVLEVTPEPTLLLPVAPLWYVDEAAREFGMVETGLPPALAETWLHAPALEPEEAVELARELEARDARISLPKPARYEVETLKRGKPVPCLRLTTIKPSSRYAYQPLERINVALFTFDYDGMEVRDSSLEREVVVFHEGKIRKLARNRAAEERARALLGEVAFSPISLLYYGYSLEDYPDHLGLANDNAWVQLFQGFLPRCREQGWRVEIDDSFGIRIVEPEEWYTDVAEGSGVDWFGVEMGVQLDGKTVNLLPVLVKHLQHNPGDLGDDRLALLGEDGAIMVRMPDGAMLPFPVKRLREMLGILLELFDPKALDGNGRIQMPKLRAAELAQGPESSWRWNGATELREMGRKLRNFAGITPVKPSRELKATLRPYQKDGLSWLQFLREYGLGGILADDMGLGKTVQALACLVEEKEQGRMDLPSLVVAPRSLLGNWRQEAARFAPGLKVLIWHGTERREEFGKLSDYDLIVTSYALLRIDEKLLMEQGFHYLILDEAQYIKNPKTQFAQVACSLRARHHLCLTGTPMENHLGELWSLFNFFLPGFLGDEVRFRQVFRNPIEKGRSEDRRKLLAERVTPFVLRRRKEDVVKELPPKTEIQQDVELSGKQRDLYETIRLAMHQRVRDEVARKGVSRSHIIILDALLKLRQVCCDPRLLKLPGARAVQESAKLELLMDLLPEMIAEGRRILLFSQFTSMLALIEPELSKAGIDYVMLTGQTRDRETPVKRFQEREVPVFLISLKAGGTGLNLTAADTVIHYDPWWNPAVENQATDRAHRIGQDKSVFVYKFMTKGTVEEKILELQKRKKELVEGLLSQDAKRSLKISQKDIDVLFAPIGT